MLVKKAQPLPVECIVRGYISGSGWKEYQQKGKHLRHCPAVGPAESAKLPEPIFTPSTKAELGEHDENISFEQAGGLCGKDLRRPGARRDPVHLQAGPGPGRRQGHHHRRHQVRIRDLTRTS